MGGTEGRGSGSKEWAGSEAQGRKDRGGKRDKLC